MKKLFIVLMAMALMGCTTTMYSVSMDSTTLQLNSNADSAYFSTGDTKIGYANNPNAWDMFWGGVGGWVGHNTGFHAGYFWHDNRYGNLPPSGDIVTSSEGGSASSSSKATGGSATGGKAISGSMSSSFSSSKSSAGSSSYSSAYQSQGQSQGQQQGQNQGQGQSQISSGGWTPPRH